MFRGLQYTMVDPFVVGSSPLFMLVLWNKGDHLWEGIQENFQLKWLWKLISFLKSHSKNLEASSFNNINWIGFYHLIKLHFCMGLNIIIKQINSIIFFTQF